MLCGPRLHFRLHLVHHGLRIEFVNAVLVHTKPANVVNRNICFGLSRLVNANCELLLQEFLYRRSKITNKSKIVVEQFRDIDLKGGIRRQQGLADNPQLLLRRNLLPPLHEPFHLRDIFPCGSSTPDPSTDTSVVGSPNTTSICTTQIFLASLKLG